MSTCMIVLSGSRHSGSEENTEKNSLLFGPAKSSNVEVVGSTGLGLKNPFGPFRRDVFMVRAGCQGVLPERPVKMSAEVNERGCETEHPVVRGVNHTQSGRRVCPTPLLPGNWRRREKAGSGRVHWAFGSVFSPLCLFLPRGDVKEGSLSPSIKRKYLDMWVPQSTYAQNISYAQGAVPLALRAPGNTCPLPSGPGTVSGRLSLPAPARAHAGTVCAELLAAALHTNESQVHTWAGTRSLGPRAAV